jgi:hypothetical protein
MITRILMYSSFTGHTGQNRHLDRRDGAGSPPEGFGRVLRATGRYVVRHRIEITG